MYMRSSFLSVLILLSGLLNVVCVVGLLGFLSYQLTEKTCSPLPSLTCDGYQRDSCAAAQALQEQVKG